MTPRGDLFLGSPFGRRSPLDIRAQFGYIKYMPAADLSLVLSHLAASVRLLQDAKLPVLAMRVSALRQQVELATLPPPSILTPGAP